jgi:hypothetical protein
MTKFDKPIGEWISEEVDVAVIEPVIKDGKVVGVHHATKKVPQRTMYTKASESKVDCGDKQHDWYIPDRHNHVAFCRNCKKRRFIRAVYERVIDGKILNRDTSEQID